MEAATVTHMNERSYERMRVDDLRGLAIIALKHLDAFVEEHRENYGWCENHLLLVCLCQGAAEHYVRGERGIKDFDVWTFYEAQAGEKPFPWRRHGTEDFGPSRFGRNPRDKGFTGRRIDVFGRSIARHAEQATEDAVLKWVRSKRRSAQHIVTRPVVVLYPERECGRVIWDPQADIREQGDGNRATDEIQTGSTSTIACAASSSL